MVTKKSAPKKKAVSKPKAKKVLTAVQLAKKVKAEVKKLMSTRSFLQTGKSNKDVDKKRTALPVGVRISKKGNRYTETRENRSDRKQGGKKGTWL
jgi:hypothetical protein